MRSTTTESRLNGLALINVHKDKHVNIDLVVNQLQIFFFQIVRNKCFISIIIPSLLAK